MAILRAFLDGSMAVLAHSGRYSKAIVAAVGGVVLCLDGPELWGCWVLVAVVTFCVWLVPNRDKR